MQGTCSDPAVSGRVAEVASCEVGKYCLRLMDGFSFPLCSKSGTGSLCYRRTGQVIRQQGEDRLL